jgi:Zn-dependent alcohol dehydrogenase
MTTPAWAAIADELLTRSYPLTQINAAYEALERGEVARSVVTFG